MEEENNHQAASLTLAQQISNPDSGAEEDNGEDSSNGGSALGAAGGGTTSATNSKEDRTQTQPVAEFLYQLTKMLTDDNAEIIEWSDGRIKVHHPERLEGEVLHKYFRHSKFASFQRQLNYFGFRKIAGKGKMSPCSYVNENATADIRSLLLIKRKTNGSAARKAALQKQAAALVSQASAAATSNPYAGLAATYGLSGALGSAAGGGGVLSNSQALSSAMALLSENALRAGITGQLQSNSGNHLNLLALQAQQQQQQALHKHLLEQQQQQQSKMKMEHHPGRVKSDSMGDMQRPTNTVSFAANVKQEEQQNSSTPSLEQLHAQLKALQEQQKQSQQQNGSSNPATAALLAASASQQQQFNNATLALSGMAGGSMPATAAMEHAAPSSAGNLFESAANLKSLLDEHAAQTKNSAEAQAAAAQFLRSQANLSNTGGFPPESTMSFGNLLGSSNRISSLLSLNSFLGSASREASLVDIAAFRDQLAAAQGAANLGDVASKLRHSNNSSSNHS